jgi:hypothetical protein
MVEHGTENYAVDARWRVTETAVQPWHIRSLTFPVPNIPQMVFAICFLINSRCRDPRVQDCSENIKNNALGVAIAI